MNRPRIAVAPMMDWTDRHCRYFMRLLNGSALLYTEMLTAAALIHGNPKKLLEYDAAEHPVALQLGGSNPESMAQAARLGADAGYDEININVGCPSDRVQSGAFGACLMARPEVVAECVAEMRAAVSVPVTVKTRIGIDDQDSVAFLHRFIETIQSAGCETVIVHARKAHLQGLSPKENRSVPPLDYARVYALTGAFPGMNVIINGGISTLEACREHLNRVAGVMIGRQAYQRPWFLAELAGIGTETASKPESRESVVERMLPYIEQEVGRGTPLHRITRHMLGLFADQPGARSWRRYLSEHACRRDANADVLLTALAKMPRAAVSGARVDAAS